MCSVNGMMLYDIADLIGAELHMYEGRWIVIYNGKKFVSGKPVANVLRAYGHWVGERLAELLGFGRYRVFVYKAVRLARGGDGVSFIGMWACKVTCREADVEFEVGIAIDDDSGVNVFVKYVGASPEFADYLARKYGKKESCLKVLRELPESYVEWRLMRLVGDADG